MEWLLPLLMLSRGPGKRNGALAEQLLPHVLPGAPAQRIAFAAISAERQLARQALAERQLVEEAVAAGKFGNPSDLERFPALKLAFSRLPADVQARLLPDRRRSVRGRHDQRRTHS